MTSFRISPRGVPALRNPTISPRAKASMRALVPMMKASAPAEPSNRARHKRCYNITSAAPRLCLHNNDYRMSCGSCARPWTLTSRKLLPSPTHGSLRASPVTTSTLEHACWPTARSMSRGSQQPFHPPQYLTSYSPFPLYFKVEARTR